MLLSISLFCFFIFWARTSSATSFQRHFMIQGSSGKHQAWFSALLLSYTVDNEKKVPYPATRPMIADQSITDTPGLLAENLVCFLPILQFNKFHAYETCSMSSQKPRISLKKPPSSPRGTNCWMFEFGTRIWEHDLFYSWTSLQLVTPGEPSTHNVQCGASPASPSVSPFSTNHLACLPPPLPASLPLSGHRAWYLRRLSGCRAFSKCLVRDSLRLLSLHDWWW